MSTHNWSHNEGINADVNDETQEDATLNFHNRIGGTQRLLIHNIAEGNSVEAKRRRKEERLKIKHNNP